MNNEPPKAIHFITENAVVLFKIVVILNVIIAIFFQDLTLIFNDALQNQSTSYILAVPFIIAYLIYRKRKIVNATISIKSKKMFKFLTTSEIIGALLLLISILLYWYGSYTFSPIEYHISALPIFTGACILLFFNVQTLKELLFPLVFLFLLVPPPAEFLYSFGSILSSTSSIIAYSILNLLNLPVTLGNEQGTPAIYLSLQDGSVATFAVDISCSGVYSLIGFFIFALVMAYIVRGTIYKKIGTFFLGFPLIYLLNIVRIFVIVLIGYYAGINLALDVFHLLGGWVLIFIGSLLILFISEKLFKVRIFSSSKTCSECNPASLSTKKICINCSRIFTYRLPQIEKKDIVKIISLVLTTLLILSIQVPIFAITEGPAEIIHQTPQGQQEESNILPNLTGYTFDFIRRDSDFENISGQDVSLIYAYYPNDTTRKTIWVQIEIAETRSPLHPWEVCLISYWTDQGVEPKASQIVLEDLEIFQNPPIIGRYFQFEWLDYRANINPTQSVLYWYETSTFKFESTSETKNVKISVITYPKDNDTSDQLKNELLSVAQQIANHWQPIKPWSNTALAISQNGLSLIAVILSLLVIVILLTFYNKYKTKQANQTIITKLSKDYRLILKSVENSQSFPSLSNISVDFEKTNNSIITTKNLLSNLEKLKEIGLIKEKIKNIEDEPFQVWRIQF